MEECAPCRPGGGGRQYRQALVSNSELQPISTIDLVRELLWRLKCTEPEAGDTMALLADDLRDSLSLAFNVHENRFSKRRLCDVFCTLFGNRKMRPDLKGATVLDLGCGCENPLSLVFLFQMLGARRGFGVDLGSVVDPPRAVRALAEAAAFLLVDPTFTVGDYPVDRAEVLQQLAPHDLTLMSHGDLRGIDESILSFHMESVTDLSMADGDVDFVVSTSFLEHVPDPVAAVASIARVTRAGGWGSHIIDTADHGVYAGIADHSLDHLANDSDEFLINSCSRWRLSDFIAEFNRQGLEVVEFDCFGTTDVPDDYAERFVAPYSGYSRKDLGEVCGVVVTRKVG